MSTFKSFASQPSLGDYLIQVPDETAKIKEQTRETVRKMDRAEQFRRGNAELYLRAQKLAQDQEEYSRKLNYDLETENRKFYRDALDRDNNIQIANDRIAAQKQQDTYSKIAQFSQTAAKLFSDANKQFTEKQTNSNTVNTLIAGTTFEENLAIKGMINNLTEAEFAQQNFIKQLVSEGKDVKALWTLYKNRNTRGFIENAGVIQNTAYGAGPYLQEVLKNLDQNLTPEQQRLQVETAWREWLANSFIDANGRQLNPKLVSNIGAPIYSRAYTSVMGDFDKLELDYNKKQLLQDTYRGYDNLNSIPDRLGKFQEGIILNSERARSEFASWIVQGLKNGTITPDEAEQYYTQTFPKPGVNGKTSSWITQYPSDPNIGLIRTTQRQMRSQNIAEAKNERFEEHQRFEVEANGVYEAGIADNNWTAQEHTKFAEWLRENAPADYDTEALINKSLKQTDNARQEVMVRTQLQQELERGTLSYVRLDDPDVSFKLKEEFLPKVDKQQAIFRSDVYKEGIALIKKTIAGHPRLVPPPGADKLTSNALQYQQEQVEAVRKFASSGEISLDQLQQVINGKVMAIKAKQEEEGTIVNGDYSDSILKNKGSISSYKKSLASQTRYYDGLSNKKFFTDSSVALRAYGVTEYNEDYDEAAKGTITTRLRSRAAQARISPLALINHVGAATDKPPITLDSQTEALQKLIPRPAAKLVEAYYTPKRYERAVAIAGFNGMSVANSPTRLSFGPSQTSTVEDLDLRGALNAISNYESAGAGGYNAVNQGGEAGGTKIPAGFYSGDFRNMPQHGGRAFTDLNIGEVMDLQYDPGKSKMSDAEWVKAGKLHAVSRYQFIGPTLKGLVQRHNIPRTAKFTPRLQDLLGLSLLKSGGPGQWVGLRNASKEDMNIILKAKAKMKAMPWEELNSMIQAELANT